MDLHDLLNQYFRLYKRAMRWIIHLYAILARKIKLTLSSSYLGDRISTTSQLVTIYKSCTEIYKW